MSNVRSIHSPATFQTDRDFALHLAAEHNPRLITFHDAGGSTSYVRTDAPANPWRILRGGVPDAWTRATPAERRMVHVGKGIDGPVIIAPTGTSADPGRVAWILAELAALEAR